MSAAIPTHPCTAWCAHPTHVDLVHASGTHWSVAEIAGVTQADYAREGVAIEVDRVEPASEAPAKPEPWAAGAPARPGWLVWWQSSDVEVVE